MTLMTIQKLIKKVENYFMPSESKELVLSPKNAVIDENLINEDKVFWAVEELFVAGHVVPDTLQRTVEKHGGAPNVPPVKTAFNVFGSFEDASAYGQRLNKPLVILEIRPSAFVRPQLALIAKINETK